MRIIVEQSIPTDLGTLRRFIDEATRLVAQDVTSLVCYNDAGFLSICSARELEQ